MLSVVVGLDPARNSCQFSPLSLSSSRSCRPWTWRRATRCWGRHQHGSTRATCTQSDRRAPQGRENNRTNQWSAIWCRSACHLSPARRAVEGERQTPRIRLRFGHVLACRTRTARNRRVRAASLPGTGKFCAASAGQRDFRGSVGRFWLWSN